MKLQQFSDEELMQEVLRRMKSPRFISEEEIKPKDRPDTGWYVVIICACPTNYNMPFRVAIQAKSFDVALTRLKNLYPAGSFSGKGCRMQDALSKEPETDVDILSMSKRHPLL